jgi:outer membrane lipoprotein
MEGFLAVCYNPAMSLLRPGLMAAILLIVSGCASLGGQAEQDASGSSQITYAQVKAAPESFNGQSVTFGGKVLGARRLKEGTRIEILQLPLTSSAQPTTDLSKSQGRFIALQKQFLDPATIPAGTFLTITGAVAGSLTMPLDEMEYTYPLVHVGNLRVWADDQEEAPRIRPYLGSRPYWGPYWSPYWAPWPYYW